MPRDYSLKTYVLEEMRQRQEEGCDVGPLVPQQVNLLLKGADRDAWMGLYHQLNALTPGEDFPYDEPTDLATIKEKRPDGPRSLPESLPADVLRDRILGAWLGRCAGCALGKPTEGRDREWIRRYLEAADAYPLSSYFPVIEPFPEGLALNASYRESALGHIRFMARDDDLDYTILGLHVLEEHGMGFETGHVGAEWLNHLPYTRVYTAERMAYRNLVDGLEPPETALVINPYREWIGAQIRADIYGYVCPGRPERGAELAYRDAVFSHVTNGVYGAMLVAAMLSAALVVDDIVEVIKTGLREIPEESRLAEAVRDVLAWRQEVDDWEEARDRLEEKYGCLDKVHTVNNASVVLQGLLYGEGDFARTICLAVMGGWDTDCNGATAGSILGAMLGGAALPESWVAQFNDTIHTGLAGFGVARISDLAERTYGLAAANVG